MTADHTPQRKVRVADPLWAAYATVCKRVFQRTRSEDLVAHIRAVVNEHGNEAERAQLEQAERQATERGARRQVGRPPKG